MSKRKRYRNPALVASSHPNPDVLAKRATYHSMLRVICASLLAVGAFSAPISNRTMQEYFMRRAIRLALDAQTKGSDPYGALIADPVAGRVVAEGRNHASHNPIWHGEMAAIANLSALSTQSVYAIAGELELYTTAEPCPMCMAAIGWSGFGAVLYGTSIPFIAAQGHDQINVRATDIAARTPMHNITVVGGVLEQECNQLYMNVTGQQGSASSRTLRGGKHRPVHRHGHDHSAEHEEAAAAELNDRLGRVISDIGVLESEV